MLRVLHLIDLDAGFQTRRGAESIAREVGTGFEIESRTIGEGGDYAGLISAIIHARRDPPKPYDLIHAWGGRSLAAAVRLGGRIVYTLPDSTSLRAIRWLRAVMPHREVQVICPSATLRRICIERGVPVERCHTIRPGVQFSRIHRRRDTKLRESLGFGDKDRVLLFTGESTRAAGHTDSLWGTALLHVMDPRYRALAWGRGSEVARLKRFADGQSQPGLLRLAEPHLGRSMEFEDLLPAADIILATPTGPAATLPVAIAMAAALPIVATVSYTLSELLEDRHTALLAAPGSPRALAQRVLDLERDPNVQWAISDMARTEAYEYFALTRFVNQHRTIYRQIAEGAAVTLPESAPGAGLRFHGRG